MPKILTIKRSKWRRGGGGITINDNKGSTRLLNDKGLMCCLGFDAIGCGFTPADILGKVDPEELAHYAIAFPAGYLETRVESDKSGHLTNSKPVFDAISANDDRKLSDGQRELKVRAALMELGWDYVVFVD